MWQVENRTPFASHGYFDRNRDGAEYWVVAVRAQFRIRDDGLVDTAEIQAPVRFAPEYDGPDALELTAESDFAPFRPQADLIVAGYACALGGGAVDRCDISLRVGALEKRGRAFGPRRLRRGAGWRAKPAFDAPELFERQRLTWRSALGGVDPFAEDAADSDRHPDNPIGVGWTARWRDLPENAELVLPTIESAEEPISAGEPLPQPFGFGPLQRAWRPRLRHAGAHDEAWMANRAPLPPEDFSEAFHQAAPADQLTTEPLRGGEPVELEGLHPEGPLRFRLPQIIFETRTRIGRDRSVERPRLISATIDGTARTLDMTWNAQVLCTGRDHHVEGSTLLVRQIAGVAR